MEMSNLPAIITAIAACITALGGIIVTIFIFIPNLKTSRSTHKIVNQQRTDMQNWNRALVRALKSANVEVPIDQSIDEIFP
jgi:hypothetical protein